MATRASLGGKAVVRGLKNLGKGLSALAGHAHRIGWLPAKGKVRAILDVPYTTRGGKQAVDVYLPEKPLQEGKNHPWVFFIHGGGWVIGDRKMGAVMGRILAARGVALVSAGYRLAPRATLTQQLEDLQEAMRFTHANAAKWNLDTSRFAIAGESAGGHLTMRLSQEFPQELPHPRAIVGIYGLYDLEGWSRSDHPVAKGFLKTIRKGEPLAHFFGRHTAHRELPWDHVPVLLLHGEADRLVPVGQSHKLAKLLKSQGVEVTVKTYPGRDHAFNYNGRGSARRDVIDFYKTFMEFFFANVVKTKKQQAA